MLPLDEDLRFLPEAELCDLLHCLPSELDGEDELRVTQLLIYFAAKGKHQQREQAQAQSRAQLHTLPGG